MASPYCFRLGLTFSLNRNGTIYEQFVRYFSDDWKQWFHVCLQDSGLYWIKGHDDPYYFIRSQLKYVNVLTLLKYMSALRVSGMLALILALLPGMLPCWTDPLNPFSLHTFPVVVYTGIISYIINDSHWYGVSILIKPKYSWRISWWVKHVWYDSFLLAVSLRTY